MIGELRSHKLCGAAKKKKKNTLKKLKKKKKPARIQNAMYTKEEKRQLWDSLRDKLYCLPSGRC